MVIPNLWRPHAPSDDFAADAGNTTAMFNLGVLLTERGGEGDLAEAEEWYRRAAATDNSVGAARAQEALASLGGEGGVPQ